MIHLLGKLPPNIAIAVSGGPDSMACLDFLSKKHKTIALFFNHGTNCSKISEKIVQQYCINNKIPYHIGCINRDKKKTESMEEYWRNQRYSFFSSINLPIITCHHLDDVVEWWIYSSLHGNPKIIPYSRENYKRPFLLNKKSVFLDWCRRKNVPYYNDPSNRNPIYNRSCIRHNVIPTLLKINPGIHKVLKRKVLEEFSSNTFTAKPGLSC